MDTDGDVIDAIENHFEAIDRLINRAVQRASVLRRKGIITAAELVSIIQGFNAAGEVLEAVQEKRK